MTAVDLTRIGPGGTLLEAAERGLLNDFAAMAPASSDDLVAAAGWLTSYEGDPDEDAELLAALARAAGFLMREVENRQIDAVQRRRAAEGRPRVSRERVRQALRTGRTR